MSKTNEKRKYRRVKADVKIKIDRLDPMAGSDELQVGHITNISAGGVFLESKWSFDIGEYVSVHFLGPNSFELFKVTAKVLRVEKKAGFGHDVCVMFLNLSEDDEKRLDYYLTYK